METHTKYANGEFIKVGDLVSTEKWSREEFTVVFENNAFRKDYTNWNQTLIKPVLEFGKEGESYKYKKVL